LQTSEKVRNADALWEAYLEDPSVEAKNDLLLHYLHLVRKLVLRMMPKYKSFNDYDDLISSGVLGLMDAIGRYDRVRNVKFETYACKRIRGEILDYMRRQDWVSSSMRSKIKTVQNAFDHLSVRFGREATEQEVADHLGMKVRQVREALDNEYIHNIIYFESVIAGSTGEEGLKLMDTVQDPDRDADPEMQYEKKEMSAILSGVLDMLPKNERMVIELYYSEELLLREIAEVLQVTESRVSQIHSKALKRIQELMKRQLR
jgi:RNA polymerase sigma factor for flagellar operon FliA